MDGALHSISHFCGTRVVDRWLESSDHFEARTSTGSGLFALLNDGFEQMFRQIVSIREKTLSNTNLEALRHDKKRIRFTSGSRASLKNVVAYKHPTDSGQTSCGRLVPSRL